MGWYEGKGEIREYLKELNKEHKVRKMSAALKETRGRANDFCKIGARVYTLPAGVVHELFRPSLQVV